MIQKPTIKILVAYHKPSPLFVNTIMTPIHVGRALHPAGTCEELKSMLGDDSGDNISHLNPYYSEMTACYWAWKNYASLGNPDYFGLAHYRRFLGFAFADGEGFISIPDIGRITPQLYDENVISDIVTKYDICIRTPITVTRDITDDKGTLIGKEEVDPIVQYAFAHDVQHLEMALNYILRIYPEYKETIGVFLNSTKQYFCNLFVMKKQFFFKYAEWIFPLLDLLHHSIDYTGLDAYQKRAVGFVAERLTGLFVLHHLLHGEASVKHVIGVDIG